MALKLHKYFASVFSEGSDAGKGSKGGKADGTKVMEMATSAVEA